MLLFYDGAKQINLKKRRIAYPETIKNLKKMKNIPKTILAIVASGLISCALWTQQAQAVQISGALTFGGTVELNTGSAGTATAVTAWHGTGGVGLPTVQSVGGGFVGFVTSGDATTFHAPWSFASGPVPAFWSVDGFTFDLTESHVFSQGGFPPGVTVNGSGFVSGHGFDPTFMTWSFTTQDPPAGTPPVFSFSAASGTIPDSGSTVALLGLAIVGVEALRRKMRTTG
jgi:hypothetical protein